MAIKVGLGKWPEAKALVNNFGDEVAAEGFRILPISIAHARESGLNRAPHRDPFDRLLAAQAVHEGLTLVTADPKLAGLGASVLW
jgi:PIN domain nuclease of toxin-antitoxin system